MKQWEFKDKNIKRFSIICSSCVKQDKDVNNITSNISSNITSQACTNPGSHVAQANKFYMVVHITFGTCEWNLLCITLLAHRIFWQVLNFWKICGPHKRLHFTIHIFHVGCTSGFCFS